MSLTTIPARVCIACASFPCRCLREPKVAPYIEPRIAIERCVCSGYITVFDPTAPNIMAAVRGHNESIAHMLWRRGR